MNSIFSTQKVRLLFALALGLFLALPSVLHAEEVEIQLMEVIGIGFIPGDNPMDDPEQSPPEPPRPTTFHASINGNTLSVTKLQTSIPSAQVTVVNAATGNVVLSRQLTSSMSEQIGISGMHILHIQTDGGALIGQFVVQ